MTAPALFIVFPFAFGLFEVLFSEKRRLIAVLSLAVCLILIVWAILIPINSMIIYGDTSLIYTSSLDFLGRTLKLERSQQTMLAFFYALASVGILLSLVVPSSRFFVPSVMMMTALVVGVTAVSPFIFGAMMVFAAVLIAFPMLWYERHGDGSGLMRFVLWQLMGVIFLSLGAWLAMLVDLNPTNEALMRRVLVIIFLGLVFLLGFFPTQTWLVMVMDESCPLVSGFLISLIQFSSLYILLRFMNTFIWIRNGDLFLTGLKLIGLIMLILGGSGTLFGHTLQRIQASVYIAENGMAMMLMGIRTPETLMIFLSMIFIRVLAGVLWSAAIKAIQQDHETEITHSFGTYWKRPYAVGMILVAYFSIVSLPFLVTFPLKISFLSIAFSTSPRIGSYAALGVFLGICGGFRLSYYLLGGQRDELQLVSDESTPDKVTVAQDEAVEGRQENRVSSVALNEDDESAEDMDGFAAGNLESKSQKVAFSVGMLFLLSLALYPELLNGFIQGMYQHLALIVSG